MGVRQRAAKSGSPKQHGQGTRSFSFYTTVSNHGRQIKAPMQFKTGKSKEREEIKQKRKNERK